MAYTGSVTNLEDLFFAKILNWLEHCRWKKRTFEAEWRKAAAWFACAGMDEDAIEDIKSFDWELFCKERTYSNRTQREIAALFGVSQVGVLKRIEGIKKLFR